MKESTLQRLHFVWASLYETVEVVKKDPWMPGIKQEGRMNNGAQRICEGRVTTPRGMSVMDTHHCTFAQTHRKDTKSEP